MSLQGLKKQWNKANQYLSEHVGAAEPTKLDEQFNEMERKVDLTNELVEDLINKTREYLQPNPGKALVDAGEAYRQMADVKYAMEDVVKQNFLDPLYHLQTKDLKEVNHHRKKLQGRRLDYDCKKRKQIKDDDIYMAEEKLEESKQLAETAMFNVLDNDVEQISQLCALVDAQLDFHNQTASILVALKEHLKGRVEEAGKRPRREHVPKPVLPDKSPRSKSPVPDTPQMPAFANSHNEDPWAKGPSAPSQDPWGQPPPSYNSLANNTAKSAPAPTRRQPCAKALYDFEAENEGELTFREGQVINLSSQIDENWFEGSVNGQAGFFPISYVEILVPLP